MKKQSNLINPGDIFRLGEHRLACGSASDETLVKKLVSNDKIDLVLTDPPYGIAYTQSKAGFSAVKVSKEIQNDEIVSDREYVEFTRGWIVPIVGHLAKKNSVYIFNCDKMLFALREGMEAEGIRFSQLLIWVKSHAVIGRKDYLPQHELIAYGWHGTHKFARSQDKSVLFYPKPARSPLHPTMKPIPLLRNLILNSSRIGDIVYDPFGGSGSTLIAAEQTKRRCLMIEIDPEYCQTIIDRYEKETGIQAKLLQ